MRRRALLAAAGSLAGCSAVAPPPPRLFDLGPLPPGRGTSSETVAAPLVLAEVDALAPWDGTEQWYRLDYADPRQPRAYTLSRWAAPPGQLLRQRLQARLAQDRPVVSAGGAASVLRIELEEFSQRFDAPHASRGEVRLRASLLRAGAGGIALVAQRTVRSARPAASADAAGGAAALAAAADDAADDLARWIAGQLR